MTLLSQTSTSNFRNNGFLVIPGFFTEEQVDAATDAFDNVWRASDPRMSRWIRN